MKMSDAISAAYQKKWSMVNTFNIKFNLSNGETIKRIGGPFPNDINLSIKNFSTSDLQNNPIETFLNNQWFIHNGHDQLYRFSATFKDYDNLSLYRKFMALYKETVGSYFDDVKMSVQVWKEPDWAGYIERQIFQYDGVLIESISNIDFSNETENEIAEFSVNFRATTVDIIVK